MENKNYYPWNSQEEKDFDCEIMFEIDKAMQKVTDDILTEVKSEKGEKWLEELLEYAKECETHNPFKIVNTPKGEYQEENYELLQGAWVEQSSSYGCEDCYYGTVSVKIAEGRYLEMPFSM